MFKIKIKIKLKHSLVRYGVKSAVECVIIYMLAVSLRLFSCLSDCICLSPITISYNSTYN